MIMLDAFDYVYLGSFINHATMPSQTFNQHNLEMTQFHLNFYHNDFLKDNFECVKKVIIIIIVIHLR